MLRKLIMLAITSGLAKKLYDSYRRKPTPFPTERHHPKRPGGHAGEPGRQRNGSALGRERGLG